MSSSLKEVMAAVPRVSQVETSTTLLAAERETRAKRTLAPDIAPQVALEAERKKLENDFKQQLNSI